MADFVPH